jgi:hypothetical protein
MDLYAVVEPPAKTGKKFKKAKPLSDWGKELVSELDHVHFGGFLSW